MRIALSILGGTERLSTIDIFNHYEYDEWVSEKRTILQDTSKDHKFVYAHSIMPNHSSYKCLPNEIELFKKRLQTANKEIKIDIKTILEQDKEAIIVVAGDHGAYLTENCGYIQPENITRETLLDRYSNFLAIKFPESLHQSIPNNINITQEILQKIINILFDDNILSNTISQKTIEYSNALFPSGLINDNIIQYGRDKNILLRQNND